MNTYIINKYDIYFSATAAAKSLQSCLTLCDPIDGRLPRPWDSTGKNTGGGFRFLLQCTKVKSESEDAQLCLTFNDPMDCSPPSSSVHGIFQARVLSGVPLLFIYLLFIYISYILCIIYIIYDIYEFNIYLYI